MDIISKMAQGSISVLLVVWNIMCNLLEMIKIIFLIGVYYFSWLWFGLAIAIMFFIWK